MFSAQIYYIMLGCCSFFKVVMRGHSKVVLWWIVNPLWLIILTVQPSLSMKSGPWIVEDLTGFSCCYLYCLSVNGRSYWHFINTESNFFFWHWNPPLVPTKCFLVGFPSLLLFFFLFLHCTFHFVTMSVLGCGCLFCMLNCH